MSDSAETEILSQPHPKPSLRELIRRVPSGGGLFDPPTPDELDRVARWQFATLEQRGRTLIELFRLVDAVGNYPPKREMFPGFPNRATRRS